MTTTYINGNFRDDMDDPFPEITPTLSQDIVKELYKNNRIDDSESLFSRPESDQALFTN